MKMDKKIKRQINKVVRVFVRSTIAKTGREADEGVVAVVAVVFPFRMILKGESPIQVSKSMLYIQYEIKRTNKEGI